MNKSELKKRIKALSLLILILGTFTTFFILNQNSTTFSDTYEEKDDNSDIFKFQEDSLKTSEAPTSFDGTGENINVTLHQSYLDNSFNTILNTSDSNNNEFTLPCPKDPTFNSSYTSIKVEDINAQNRTIEIETGTGRAQDITTDWSFSFEIPQSCILSNFSIALSDNTGIAGGSDIALRLYNATYNAGLSRIEPDSNTFLVTESQNIPNLSGPTWYDFIENVDLDYSNTYGGTFFIRIWRTSGGLTYPQFNYQRNTDGSDVNNSLTYREPSGFVKMDWEAALKVGLGLNDNTPNPTAINLNINNTIVTDDVGNSGYWIKQEQDYTDNDGNLDFKITADWWDVTCNISQVQINYTKTNLQAISEFTVEHDNFVIWNVSIVQTIDSYDNRITSFNTINFTIPSIWDPDYINAFNGSDPKTVYVPPLIKNRYREVQVLGAGNGTNWYLTANSTNLLSEIKCLVNLKDVSQANYSNVLSFNATFHEYISSGEINLSVYSPIPRYLNHTYLNSSLTLANNFSLGKWNISSTNNLLYGKFLIQAYWFNSTAAGMIERNITIVADTQLSLVPPPADMSSFKDNVPFNITVYYNDIGKGVGINGTPNDIISANGTVNNYYKNNTDGYYFIEYNTNSFGWGWNYIEINASKPFYNNQSIMFSFQKIINTTIEPDNIKDFGDVIKGNNKTYVFNYSDINGDPIEGASIQVVDIDPNFDWSLKEIVGVPGNYSIELDTTNVDASVSKYICNFSISATGNETQIISLQLKVVMTQTFIDIQSWDDILIRKDQLNQTVTFYFNDTDNNKVITGLTTDRITVTDNQTGLPRTRWLNTTGTPGLYDLSISMAGLNSGWLRFWITAILPPNYNWSLTYIDFYLRGNLTDIPKIYLSDPEGQGTLTPIASNYSIFEERDLYVDFNITDTDYNNNLIKSEVNSYLIEYIEIGNSTNQGFLTEDLSFDANTNSFKGYISITELPRLGDYTITIRTTKTNYEEADISFNLIIKARYNVELSIISQPDEVTAGDTFRIIFEARYNNGTNWLPLIGSNVIITPIFDGITSEEIQSKSTNSTSGVYFDITIARDMINMSLSIRLEAKYYHVETSLEISDIVINPPPSVGLTFEDLLPYLIIIGAAVAATGGSVAIYRGVIVPKKRKKARILTEVKTIFDDAINLEHVLVLYKGSGTCIYFKSFGSEQIDPELISGFISAISSFGKDLVSQEELNEITYGDKMLLLSDGEYIRVALVLSKKASLILRRNLMEFIHAFERAYTNDLPNWRGQLNKFRGAGSIIDEILSTSIILPHEITYEHSNVKALKNTQSRDVIKIANNLMKDSERNFFFIATLLKEATEKTGKGTAEIFIGIKELRDTKILMPIEISTIEKKPISQQEMNLINQKISALVNLTPEERQKLVNDLAQVGPAEREAYFVSLAEQHEIVSAPIDSKPGATVIETIKEAKKEIKNLKKIAMVEKKKKDHEKSMKILQNAIKIALNWELVKESQEIDDLIRQNKIEDLYSKMKTLEKEAKFAVKKKNFNEATQKYRISSKIASEIFKLGVTYMTKEVKRLSNKAKEYEKLA